MTNLHSGNLKRKRSSHEMRNSENSAKNASNSDFKAENSSVRAPTHRARNGRFVPGVSGNSAGVSREIKQAVNYCKQIFAAWTPEMCELMREMATNKKEPAPIRYAAAKFIIEHAIGKPVSKQEIEVTRKPPTLIVNQVPPLLQGKTIDVSDNQSQ